MSNTTMGTCSGRQIDLLDINPSDIDFNEIGFSLSNIPRFTGHMGLGDWYVAQHCLLSASMVRPVSAPYALLHDAHEAFSNDLSTPFKNAMAAIIPNGDKAYRMLCARFDAAIHTAAGLQYPPPEDIRDDIKEADDLLCSAEQFARMVNSKPKYDSGKLWRQIVDVPREEIRHEWNNACQRLLPRFNTFEGAAE